MAISELQNIRNELARIRSGGASQSPTAEAQTDLKSSEKNTGNGVGYTLGKLWGGIVRSHEGWFDAAIAQAADVFGNDELAERVMKNDWMDYGKYDANFNPGKGWEFAGDVASGVGNMLPAIALSFVPFAGAGLSQGWFMQSASGQAVSDAVKETGELTNKEWAYGTASGLLEGAIEKVSGGIGGTKAGKVLGKQLGKSTLGKLAVSAAGEGGEEVASDILDPFLRKITGMSDTYEAPTLDELGRTFAVGATTGAVMGGASRGIQAAQAGGFNNLNAAEATQELTERQADNNLRQTEGKKALYTEEDIARTKENLSKRLQKMDSNTRAQFLKANANIANQFNEDGTVKTAIAPDTYNTNAYSASLQGREGSFAYKPIAETSNATAQAKQVMDTLTKITDGKTNIVLTEDALTTESGGNANGLYKDGIIYLNANATDYQKTLTVGVHEVIHGLEGTKEYEQLAKSITEEIKNDPDLAQQYNIDKYRAAYDAILEGEWTETTKDYQAVTEIFADFLANKVVNNEQLLRNLSVRNSNVFVRFLNWVRNSIAKLGESAEERVIRKDLQKLEKMLVNALEAGAGGISLEEVEELSKSAEKARKAQDGNIQSVKFGENKNADGKLATARAQIDVDNFDPIGYTEIALPTQERNRVQSEALKWSNKRNVPLKVSLANEYTYLCMLDEDGEIHIFRKEKTGNIHERGNEYVNQNRKGLDNAVEIVRAEQGVNAANNVSNRREARATDTNNNRQVRQEGERYGRGYRQDGVYADRTQERKGIVYYDSESDVKSTSRASIDVDADLADFPSIDKWFDSLTAEELRELIDNDYTVEDISEELNADTKKMRYLIRREGLGDSYVEDSKKAVMKQSRIDEAIEDSGASNPTYARDYITAISPKDFIDLTVTKNHVERDAFDAEVIGDHGSKMGEWDYEKALQTSRSPYLQIDKATGRVIGHNGRHRIRALEKAGIQSVEIQVEFFDEDGRLIKYDAETIPKMAISSQFDTDIETTISKVIPLNESHRAEIEATYGEKATPKAGVRFSIDVDSLGNQLSKEQQEYFKDSKVRDEDGNLLVVYHGTRKADFTEFKRNINFYTDSEEMADSYAPSSEKYVGYLNIENPFVIDANGERWSRIPIDAKTKAFLEKYGSSTFNEGGKWRTSIDDIASAIESGIDEGELDYDGIIIKNIDDTGRYWKTRDNIVANDYITFKSNQFKNTTNKTPTKNADIRYSLDTELDNKTTARVQTAVNNMTMAERWQKVLEDLKLGKADQWIKAQIAWTDEQAGIIQAGKNVGVVVHGEVQRARVAKASAINMLNDSQRDYSGKKRVGDSLKAIFKPIQSRGKKVAQAFNLYLLHQLNVDRMSAVERGLRDEVAPVFEEEVDKAFSLEKSQQLEKQYPEFKETAARVWNYNQNLLQYRVDAGLITQTQADQMTKMYPHYVPAFYEHNGGGTSGAFVGQKGIAVKTGIKSAKGSTGVSDIKDVQASIAKQTVAVVRAASINKVVEKLYDGAVAKGDFTDIEEVGREKMTDPDVDYDKEIPKNNEVYFYKDGERITLAVTQYVDAGFRGLTAGAQLGDPLTTLSAKAISLFKKLVTSYNPLFAVTNTLRDAQEALFYTKYPKRFFANYGKALVTRKSDTRLKELWEQYKAMGGAGSGYFSQDTGVFDGRSKLRRSVEWLGDKMQIVNEWVEQAPRFAEFVASVEAGNSLEQALYDSAEVTTNFSRGGKMAKALNRHLIPFLNPSIQGWSKMWRGWVAPMDGKSAAEIERLSKQSKGRRFLSNYGALMFKAILCGVSVGLFNDMLYRWIDDDEDYANLPLNIKENYYLIKVGKKFIKIPKGRVVALYGSVWTRLSEAMNGNEDALNAWDWAKSASEMVSPLESAFRSIIAPVRDVQTNTTWYGGQIENASMENLAPSERYDEGTSKIAIAMGKAFNYSPKKIHYILDQYSGVIGDVILPLTTNKAEKNMVSARFVVDPLYNSDVSTRYYDYKEELTYAKNSGDINAKLMLKYMNEVQDDLSKMYQQKRDIANDKSLSNKEKREQTEIVQSLINATLSSSVDMADEFEQLLINSGFEQAVAILGNNATYKKMDEKAQNSAYNKLTEYYYEACLARLNGAKLGTKYTLYGSINATDLVVYLTEIGNIESDKDKKGNTIQGSRKEKVQKYIQGLKLTAQQKYILSYLAGYAPTDNGKSAISKYLKNNGYTQKEINEIWN